MKGRAVVCLKALSKKLCVGNFRLIATASRRAETRNWQLLEVNQDLYPLQGDIRQLIPE